MFAALEAFSCAASEGGVEVTVPVIVSESKAKNAPVVTGENSGENNDLVRRGIEDKKISG